MEVPKSLMRKKDYNIALAKRAFWLANSLDPFARGLHAHVSLFICTFSRQFFFIDVNTF